MKEVYKALEALEGGEKLVELVKASEKMKGELEKKNRELTSEAEQYADLDLTKLKTASEFIEGAGGVEAIQTAIAKADGFDTNEAKLKEQKDAYDALVRAKEEEAEGFTQRIAESNLRAELLPKFVGNFNESGAKVLLDHAMRSGMVGTGEGGLFFKDGDSITPFSAGGFDKLKEHSDFAFALKKPSGGNEGAGSGAGGNTSTGTKTLLDKLESEFQA